MRKYKCENWTMGDIAKAMKGRDEQGRKIIIPIYQRGKRWQKAKRDKFIDSLLLGYPVGTLLFAEHAEKTYSVIDGLQRSTTICEYILHPTRRENLKNVDSDVLAKCREVLFPGNANETIKETINSLILSCIETKRDFNELTAFDIATTIIKNIPSNVDYETKINGLVGTLQSWFDSYKKDFETILQTEMPIIVYSGDSNNLNEIFERINKQGEQLNDYEIYAASWRLDKYKINNSEIIEKVIKKYDSLVFEDYELEGYDSDEYRRNKELTAFEYLFGLGKYLIEEYDFLNLESAKKDNEVTPVGFELIDACLNSSKKVSELSQIIYERKINLNLLERRLKESIEFVYQSISPICDFKGNKRKKRYLHPKYFIYALIAFTLNEMYDIKTLNKKDSWDKNKKFVSKQILHHYVYEIVNNDWHDGGIGKMYSAVKEKSFLEEISKKSWESLLDGYFSKSLMPREVERVANPSNADNILLNCIYLNIFTVNDQLSSATFDIEHLATKDKMKRKIKETNSSGLPISSIANQCYLPETINRKKKDKTIYEENKEKGFTITIEEIENKYSFTKESDFEFLDLPYQAEDAKALEEYYIAYLENRFKIQKQKIFEFLGV